MNLKSIDEMNNEHDFLLIGKAQNGSLDAFNHLVLKYQDLLYNHAYASLGIRQAAEDTTQESMIKAFQKIRNYQDCFQFRTENRRF